MTMPSYTIKVVSDLGKVNTFPDANSTKRLVERPAKGHEECFDQYTLDYGNRKAGIIALSDGLPGRSEDEALHGSGKVYTGQNNQNIKFEFTVELSELSETDIYTKTSILRKKTFLY